MKKIFVHIPKNGGTSLRHRTSPVQGRIIQSHQTTTVDIPFTELERKQLTITGDHPGYYHRRWRDFKPKIIKNHQAFAIIRNPWSRLVSRYTFAMKKKPLPVRPDNQSFEEFLEERNTWGNVPYLWCRAVRGWYQQLEYVTDTNGNIQCDILRFEHLNEDVTKYFGLNTEVPVINSSDNKKPYQDYYTETTQQLVADWYAQDIDFFGFTFNGSATKHIWNINNQGKLNDTNSTQRKH